MTRSVVILSLVAASGCGYRAAEYTTGDGSRLCLSNEPLNATEVANTTSEADPAESFAEDERLWVNVIFHHAVGEDCDQIEEAWCNLAYDGSTVHVEAGALWKYRKKREMCDGPVTALVASCQTVGLEPDTWTINYDNMELLVDVPSKSERPCMELNTAEGAGCNTAGTAGAPTLGLLMVLAAIGRRRLL